ncbi:hypothetical protein BDZ89DRAFT_1033669 [Hymenopellis radicata]|nr:hypothetical protein BDZ89DRAFT_1033669 [Hymenopellis radicata]
MATLSLHERLCAINEPRLSATDMIKDLIECLSITLTSSSVRRNTHTLCTAISRSRDLCNKINSLISASSNEDDWTSFDAYTVMVDPLEQFLLELAELSENPCIGSLDGGLLISEWIEAGKLWADNRRTTTKTLASLFETGHFKSTAAEVELKDLTLFRQHDDNAFLDELIQESSSRSSGQKSKFSSDGWSCLENTLPKLRAIRSKLQLGGKNDMTEYSVKFMLVFVGIVEVTAKTSDKVTRQHLGSHEVLSKVLAFSILLENHLDNKTDDPKLQSQREAQWKQLIDALLKASDQGIARIFPSVASPSFNELKKFPAKIRPPYYLQCLVLVQCCRDLLKEHADKSPQPAVEPVQRALASVTTALQAAAKLSQAAAGVKPNVDALKTAEVDNAFTTAVKAILFPQKLMQEARDGDASRYDAWKDKLKWISGNSPAPTVEVVVKVSGKAAPSLKLKDETCSLTLASWHNRY